MRSARSLALIAGAALFLAGCSDGSSTTPANTSSAPGTLIFNPPFRVGSVTAADFTAELASTATGQQLIGLLTQAGMPPVCGIDFYYIQYSTVGGAGETTTGSGALMVPTGPAGTCSGKRPIVLHAHATAFTKAYNLANPVDTSNEAHSEGAVIAAVYAAAQGFIVVAPNGAGYDSSSLPYHPYLNADALAKDMINALAAARLALGNATFGTQDSGKLFVTGFSGGGHPAMATVRALEAAGATVAASAPISGPYAPEAFGDVVVLGSVMIGAPGFFPLITASYQHAYHNVYNAATDFYALPYATGIESLFPGSLTIENQIASGNLPQAVFNSTTPVTGNAALDALLAVPTVPPAPPFAPAGFGNPYLVNNSVRVAYAFDVVASPDGGLAASPPPTGAPPAANPMYPLRQDLKLNDLRNPVWAPNAPMLMCGGHQDPTVFFLNTEIMQSFWKALPLPNGLITVLDIDTAQPPPGDPFAPLQLGFTSTYAALQAALGPAGAIQQYHGTVFPFCAVAAAGFFKNF